MEILTETASLALGTIRASLLFTSQAFVQIRQTLNGAWRFIAANTLLLIIGCLVAISGYYMNYNQTAIMTAFDKIYECGPEAFGVEIGIPLSAWNIIQGIYVIPSALRAVFVSNVMRLNSAIVWAATAIISTANFIRDIQDKTSPDGVLAIIQSLYELPFMIANLIIEIPVFQIPIFDTIFTTIYLLFQCLALLAEEVGVGLFKGTLYSENCNVCTYKTQFLDPTDFCYTTQFSAYIFTNEATDVNCSAASCNNVLCTWVQCLSYSAESIFSWTKPCFGFDIGPFIQSISEAGCCFMSLIDRGTFIAVSVLENIIFTILYGSSTCMPLTELVNQLDLFLAQFFGCVDDIICVFTGGNTCNFIQSIIDWINTNILFFINGIAQLGYCADVAAASTACNTDWPVPGCNDGVGFDDCVLIYTNCLELNSFWQSPGFSVVFDFFNALLSQINGALCGPLCAVDPAVATCLFSYPEFGYCPSPIAPLPTAGGPTYQCWILMEQCLEGYDFWYPTLSPLLDFITALSKIADYVLCFVYDFALCFTNAFNPGGPCNPFDVVDCPAAIIQCFVNIFTSATSRELFSEGTKLVATGFFGIIANGQEIQHQHRVEACIMIGVMHNFSMCLNGCRFEPTSCVNRDQWKLHAEVIQRIGKFQSDGKDLLKGKFGGPKYFLTDDIQDNHVNFVLPRQLNLAKAYFSEIVKDSAKYVAEHHIEKFLFALRSIDQIKDTRQRRSLETKCKPTSHFPELAKSMEEKHCIISLERHDDEDYMDRVVNLLQFNHLPKKTVNNAAKTLFNMFLRSAPISYIKNLANASRYNVSSDIVLHRQVCSQATKDRQINLFHTEKEKYVSINSMLLCDCLNETQTTKTEYYHSLSHPYKANGNAEMSCSEMKNSVQRMIVTMKMESHKKRFEEDYEAMVSPMRRDKTSSLLRYYQNKFETRLNPMAETARRYRELYLKKPTYLTSIMEPSWRDSPKRRKVLNKLTGAYGGSNDQVDLFGTILNNTFCFINGFSLLGSGAMPDTNLLEEDFYGRAANGSSTEQSFFSKQYETLKKHRAHEWLPFAERVVTSAVNNFGIDQYGIYKHGHMFYHALMTKQSHKIVHYISGEYDWNMKEKMFSPLENSSYPFEIIIPPGPPIWNAASGLSTNLGIFVFFNASIATFFEWAGYGNLLGHYNSVMESGYQPAYSQLYESFSSDDETNCYTRGSYYPCVRLQERSTVGENGQYKKYNMPRHLFIPREQFKSEQAYERYLASGNPADFNANQYFEDVINWVASWLFGVAEDAFSEIVDDVTRIVEQVNVTKELIFFLQKLDVATNCRWPDQVNGSQIYNPFCFPLIPATFGSWITPLPTTFLQPQLPWPKELISQDCVNVYNGKSFLPTLQPNYLTQNPILGFVEQGFAFSNNCVINTSYGFNVLSQQITNQLLVGSPGVGPSGGRSGSVFVYTLDTNTEVQSLTAFNLNQAEQFGYALSSYGTDLGVSAPFGNLGTGYVALYEHIGSQWTLQSNLSFLDIENPLTIANNQGNSGSNFFGGSFWMTAEYNFVGAPAWNASKGAVYVYLKGQKLPLQTLTDYPALPSLAFFGVSVASPKITSDWLIVGENLWNASIGQVFVFRRNLLDNKFYLFQTIIYPQIVAAVLVNDANLRPQFGSRVYMAEDVPYFFCTNAPRGFFAGAAGTVYCYKFNGVQWLLTITITDPTLANPGGFGVGIVFNSTTLYVTEAGSAYVRVYEFNLAYTAVTLLYTINLYAFSISGSLSSAVDITNHGFWAVGAPSINEVIYGFSGSGNTGTELQLGTNETEIRPFCPSICDYCPREYIEGGCRALKFKDYLDTFFFLLALVPTALNFLFVSGLSLMYLEQIYAPLTFILDLSRAQLLFPNTRALYLFLYFLSLIFGRTFIPIAPLLVITFVSLYFGINVILPFILPGISDFLNKIGPSTFGIFFFLIAFLLIGQTLTLFIAFNGFSFSINQLIVDLVTAIQNTGYLLYILPVLSVIKFKAGQFIYENPSDIPWADIFCSLWTYFNLGLLIVAVPLIFFLLLLAWALLGPLRTLLFTVASLAANWFAVIATSFKTNRA